MAGGGASPRWRHGWSSRRPLRLATRSLTTEAAVRPGVLQRLAGRMGRVGMGHTVSLLHRVLCAAAQALGAHIMSSTACGTRLAGLSGTVRIRLYLA